MPTADEMANGVCAVVRYIHENADKFGVDASKLVVDGISGGGLASAAMCGRLAVLGQSHLVKLAIISNGCCPGYY